MPAVFRKIKQRVSRGKSSGVSDDVHSDVIGNAVSETGSRVRRSRGITEETDPNSPPIAPGQIDPTLLKAAASFKGPVHVPRYEAESDAIMIDAIRLSTLSGANLPIADTFSRCSDAYISVVAIHSYTGAVMGKAKTTVVTSLNPDWPDVVLQMEAPFPLQHVALAFIVYDHDTSSADDLLGVAALMSLPLPKKTVVRTLTLTGGLTAKCKLPPTISVSVSVSPSPPPTHPLRPYAYGCAIFDRITITDLPLSDTRKNCGLFCVVSVRCGLCVESMISIPVLPIRMEGRNSKAKYAAYVPNAMTFPLLSRGSTVKVRIFATGQGQLSHLIRKTGSTLKTLTASVRRHTVGLAQPKNVGKSQEVHNLSMRETVDGQCLHGSQDGPVSPAAYEPGRIDDSFYGKLLYYIGFIPRHRKSDMYDQLSPLINDAVDVYATFHTPLSEQSVVLAVANEPPPTLAEVMTKCESLGICTFTLPRFSDGDRWQEQSQFLAIDPDGAGDAPNGRGAKLSVHTLTVYDESAEWNTSFLDEDMAANLAVPCHRAHPLKPCGRSHGRCPRPPSEPLEQIPPTDEWTLTTWYRSIGRHTYLSPMYMAWPPDKPFNLLVMKDSVMRASGHVVSVWNAYIALIRLTEWRNPLLTAFLFLFWCLACYYSLWLFGLFSMFLFVMVRNGLAAENKAGEGGGASMAYITGLVHYLATLFDDIAAVVAWKYPVRARRTCQFLLVACLVTLFVPPQLIMWSIGVFMFVFRAAYVRFPLLVDRYGLFHLTGAVVRHYISKILPVVPIPYKYRKTVPDSRCLLNLTVHRGRDIAAADGSATLAGLGLGDRNIPILSRKARASSDPYLRVLVEGQAFYWTSNACMDNCNPEFKAKVPSIHLNHTPSTVRVQVWNLNGAEYGEDDDCLGEVRIQIPHPNDQKSQVWLPLEPRIIANDQTYVTGALLIEYFTELE